MIFLFKKGDFQVSALNFRGDGFFVFSPKKRTTVGGGNSHIFYVHPDPWGFMNQFDDCAYFSNGWFNHHLEKVRFLLFQMPPPVGEIFYFLEVSVRR